MIIVWKDIPGYEGIYQASNTGFIKALKRTWYSGKNNCILKTKDEHVLKPNISQCGYYKLPLIKNGVIKHYRKCRLIAMTFIPNPENKPQVNHIDGNKLNDAVTNLEWNTAKENVQHSFRIGLNWARPCNFKGELSPKAKLTDEKVREIKSSSLSERKLAKVYNIHHSIINGIRKGTRWTHVV